MSVKYFFEVLDLFLFRAVLHMNILLKIVNLSKEKVCFALVEPKFYVLYIVNCIKIVYKTWLLYVYFYSFVYFVYF